MTSNLKGSQVRYFIMPYPALIWICSQGQIMPCYSYNENNALFFINKFYIQLKLVDRNERGENHNARKPCLLE